MSGVKTENKLIAIVGPTASGKSALAVALAKKINGVVISADSRQVYRGLEIGSGVATKTEMSGIPHRLISFVNPKRTFTAAEYKRLARKEIVLDWKSGKLPILAGGTGLYVRAAVDGLVIPEVKPNPKLRKKLEKMSVAELSAFLKRKDPRRWAGIDRQNPRRLIRAIEIAEALGKIPKLKYDPLKAKIMFLGIAKSGQKLEKAVKDRVKKMIRRGLISETEKLIERGLNRRKMSEFGFEYAEVLDYLNRKIASKEELADKITKETLKYAKRQMTWFRKDGRVHWVRNKSEALDLAKKFIYH